MSGRAAQIAAVLAEHRWRDVRGDYEEAPYSKHFGCSCGAEWDIAGMSGYWSWVAVHDTHVATVLDAALDAQEGERGGAVEVNVLGDHPHVDPGDGRTECYLCGKFVHDVIHSCKGVPVTRAAEHRVRALIDAVRAEDTAVLDAGNAVREALDEAIAAVETIRLDPTPVANAAAIVREVRDRHTGAQP